MTSEQYENSRTYEAQARIISKLHQHIKNEADRAMRFERLYDNSIVDATFYQLMIEAIQKHPTLQDEWQNFVALLRLCEPDLENKMKEKIKRL